MISREEAYRKLKEQGYHVDETFHPEGITFCLGWKYIDEDFGTRTVYSDGSVHDSWFRKSDFAGFRIESSRSFAPGETFPEVLPHGN